MRIGENVEVRQERKNGAQKYFSKKVLFGENLLKLLNSHILLLGRTCWEGVRVGQV